MNFKPTVCLALVCCAASAMAQDGDGERATLGVYGVVGSGGVGAGLNLPLTPLLGLRGELVQASVSDTYTEDRITYKGDAKLRGNGAFLDIRPFLGTFRLVAGATFGGSSASLNAVQDGGTFTIDGQRFAADGSGLNASIKYPSSMPYLGVGWGHGRADSVGWTFALDLGVAIGKPKVTLSGNGSLLAQPGAAERIAAEERKVQDDLNDARVLPVFKLSVGYTF